MAEAEAVNQEANRECYLGGLVQKRRNSIDEQNWCPWTKHLFQLLDVYQMQRPDWVT